MRLSPSAQSQLQAAANSFAQTVANIVASDTVKGLAGELHQRIDELTGNSGRGSRASAPRAPRASSGGGGRRRGARSAALSYGSMVAKLVEVIRGEGGTAFPGAVSKALKVSPFQRRKLVEASVAAGLVKTSGVRRSTKYSLTPKGRAKR